MTDKSSVIPPASAVPLCRCPEGVCWLHPSLTTCGMRSPVLSHGEGSTTAALSSKLRAWADDDVLGMRRDVSMRPDQFVDARDLERWAALMHEAANALDQPSPLHALNDQEHEDDTRAFGTHIREALAAFATAPTALPTPRLTTASEALGTMDSVGPFIEAPGKPVRTPEQVECPGSRQASAGLPTLRVVERQGPPGLVATMRHILLIEHRIIAYVDDPDEAALIVEAVNQHAELSSVRGDFESLMGHHIATELWVNELKAQFAEAVQLIREMASTNDPSIPGDVQPHHDDVADKARLFLASLDGAITVTAPLPELTADLLAALREVVEAAFTKSDNCVICGADISGSPIHYSGCAVEIANVAIARAEALSAHQTEEEKTQAHVDEPATSRGVATASTVEPTSTLPPTCPIHGYVMVQQFDYTLVNPNTTVATPNGTYSCLACDSQHVDEDAWRRGKVEWS